MAYVTNEEVAKFIGWDFENAGLMEQIQLILAYVEPQIDAYCNASFASDTNDKIFNGTGNQILQTSIFIREITVGILIDEDGLKVADIDLEGIILGPAEPRSGVYRYIERRASHGNWPLGLQNVKLTGKWGFDTVPVPVKGAIALTVKSFFDTRDYNQYLKYESNLSRNVQYRDDIDIIPLPARKILNSYRLQPIAFPG